MIHMMKMMTQTKKNNLVLCPLTEILTLTICEPYADCISRSKVDTRELPILGIPFFDKDNHDEM